MLFLVPTFLVLCCVLCCFLGLAPAHGLFHSFLLVFLRLVALFTCAATDPVKQQQCVFPVGTDGFYVMTVFCALCGGLSFHSLYLVVFVVRYVCLCAHTHTPLLNRMFLLETRVARV